VEVLDMIEQRMRRITEATCQAFEATGEFTFTRNYPPTINPPGETEFARNLLSTLAGAHNVKEFEPTMEAEGLQLLSTQEARLLFSDRQWRWQSSHRWPRRRALHAAQPQL
jgi:metal-dependent amidase/aminoacylase/carboxypeptidase family protein